uniref:Putative titin n=1 Tax=Lutzomyia longipalpis TaxID=7200 RepID=A0A1B0FV01_LUTLO
MGNASGKHQLRDRPRKNVHWKSAEPPAAPGKPILVPSDPDTSPDIVTIRWDKPLSDGGAPIFGYLVERRCTGSPHWVRATPGLIPGTEIQLTGLEPGWRYQFRVSAENIVGLSPPSELSDGLTVTLQRTAISVPRFVKELADCSTIENDRVEFQVQITGTPPPDINWFKDGFEIFSSRRTKILTENDTSLLVIHQTAITDEGEIKCTATNRAGHVVTRCQLKVEAPPKIRLPRQYEEGILIEADEVLRLKVGIAGRPPPSVAWLRNGEVLGNDDRHEIVTTDKNSSLKITNCRRSDRGEYNVRATNKFGDDAASFLVTVTSRPGCPGRVAFSMSVGKSVSLAWTSPEDDGGCKIGNYVVEYYRVGWNVWLKATTTRQLSTTLNDLIEGSEYKFRVKAENPYGMSEPSEESDVLFIPDPKRGITKPTSSSDTSVFIDDQRPTIIPRRKHTPTPSAAPSSQSLDSPMSKLTRMVDKSEQTHVARLKIQRPTLNIQLIPQVFDSESIARDISYGTPDPSSMAMQKKESSPSMQKDKSPSRLPEIQLNTPQELPRTMQKARELSPRPQQELKIAPIMEKIQQDKPNLLNQPKEETTPKISIKTQNKQIVETRVDESAKKPPPPVSESVPVNEMQKSWKSLEVAHHDASDAIHSSGEFVLVLYDDKDPSKRTSKQQSFDFETEEVLLPPPLSLSAPELSSQISYNTPSLRRVVSSTELLYEKAMAKFYHAVEAEEQTQKTKERSDVKQNLSKNNEVANRRSSLKHRLSGEFSLTNSGSFKQNDSPMMENPEIHSREEEKEEATKDIEEEKIVKASEEQIEYTDDYTDSTASSDESETEKFKRKVKEHRNVFSGDEELETYHPSGRQVISPYSPPPPDQSAEFLSKPFIPPSPDFVPKPILKRRKSEEVEPPPLKQDDNMENTQKNDKKPFSKIFDLNPFAKENSSSKEEKSAEKEEIPPEKPLTEKELKKKKMLEVRQESLEEMKVVIDHYSDIVREMGSGRKPPGSSIYLSAEQLKLAAEASEEEQEIVESVKESPRAFSPRKSPEKILEKTPEKTPVKMIKVENNLVKSSKLSESSIESVPEKSNARKSLRSPSRERKVMKEQEEPSLQSSQPKRKEKRAPSKTRNRSESKSLAAFNRRPMVRKVIPEPTHVAPPSQPPSKPVKAPVVTQTDTNVKVKSTINYVTDLALFVVACWIYFFKDARLCVFILALILYRQIGDMLKAHFPSWMKKKD